ncbi:MAG: MmgE/PrpD family protein [Chloroflexi bacterium]|nr:MmgE/PrpD family protein [Chloroflexota bacterium]
MPTRRIANFVAMTNFGKLSPQVVARAKVCIRDVFGTMLGGLGTKTATIARQMALEELGGREEATVFGAGKKAPCTAAAFANCVAASVLDYDDGHAISGLHPTAVIVPAALALAEREKVSGKTFIEAVVAGCEAGIRANHMFRYSPKHPFLHGSGAGGSYGAAAACAKILGLDEEGVFNALSIAGAHAPIAEAWIITATGPMTKECIGWGGLSSVASALLAKRHFTGSLTIYDETETDRSVLETLGKTYEILNLYFKPHTACRITHAAIDAALEIVKKHSITPEKVSKVTVETHKTANLLSSRRPVSIEQAQYSFPFVIGAAIAERAVGPRQMQDSRLSDPEILREADKVVLKHNPVFDSLYPGQYPSSVTVETKDGNKYQLRRDIPRGDVKDPLSEEELRAKFYALATNEIGEESTGILSKSIDRLETLTNVGPLIDLLILSTKKHAPVALPKG